MANETLDITGMDSEAIALLGDYILDSLRESARLAINQSVFGVELQNQMRIWK